MKARGVKRRSREESRRRKGGSNAIVAQRNGNALKNRVEWKAMRSYN